MFGAKIHRRAAWRGAFLTLAFLALVMKVAAPPGFMVAATGAPGAFPLVICTGHGPLTPLGQDSKGGESKSRSDAPCAFAGHGAPPTPAAGLPIARPAFAQAADVSPLPLDLVPGRGLAAPPPPSHAPPIDL